MTYDDVEAWVLALLPTTGYVIQLGEFNDSQLVSDSMVCVLQLEGGSVDVEDRTKRLVIWLLGREKSRGDYSTLDTDMETLVSATISKALLPCGAANMRAVSEPFGPGFTTEDRPWYRVSFDIQF